jgi:hypothetical protein
MSKIQELHQATLALEAAEVMSVESSGSEVRDIAAECGRIAARWCTARACGLSPEVADVETDETSVTFSCARRCDSPGLVVEASLNMRDTVTRLSRS